MPNVPRKNGSTLSPAVVVPSGKFSTDTPAASKSCTRRSTRTRSIGTSRLTNVTPSAAPIGPMIGQLATSPFAIGRAGHTGKIASGSR